MKILIVLHNGTLVDTKRVEGNLLNAVKDLATEYDVDVVSLGQKEINEGLHRGVFMSGDENTSIHIAEV